MPEARSVYRLMRPYAAVQVQEQKGCGKTIEYVISMVSSVSPLCCAKADTLLLPLTEHECVLAGDGTPISATGKFFRTAETISPYHLILDILDPLAYEWTRN